MYRRARKIYDDFVQFASPQLLLYIIYGSVGPAQIVAISTVGGCRKSSIPLKKIYSSSRLETTIHQHLKIYECNGNKYRFAKCNRFDLLHPVL